MGWEAEKGTAEARQAGRGGTEKGQRVEGVGRHGQGATRGGARRKPHQDGRATGIARDQKGESKRWTKTKSYICSSLIHSFNNRLGLPACCIPGSDPSPLGWFSGWVGAPTGHHMQRAGYDGEAQWAASFMWAAGEEAPRVR